VNMLMDVLRAAAVPPPLPVLTRGSD